MKKTALITGASSGFGHACAKLFALNGFNLVLVARRENRLKALAAELKAGTQVHTISLDLRDSAACLKAFEAIPESFKDIDVLINNAGLALGQEPAYRTQIDDWQTMVDTNISALLRVTRYFLPSMVERNSGHIVNIASIAGSWPYPGGNTYGATKAFVQQFTRGLKADLLGTNIRVSEISPGMAETEFSQVRYKQDDHKAAQVYQGTQPLTAEDIADIVYWTTSVPKHVNINSVEVMPVCQAWGPFAVHREQQ
ncbi:short chain dehydrogenase [Alteromonadaceae bacterium Bs31]|nr:short chain dehydrogenase [Alteromonadaceae bacterium Bs31]